MLSGRGLFKTYESDAQRVEAVCDVDVEIRPGEFVAIVGRSGSGKSSLLGMLSGLSRPTRGAVALDDVDLWSRSAEELADFRGRRIGIVFQFASLLPTLRAIDNVALPALLGSGVRWEDAYERARTMLDRVGLSARIHAFPGELSGGEQRRVALARALVRSPELVFADEPTADLDEDTEAEILDLLLELKRDEEFSLLIVTHSMRLAERADRVLEMRGGRLFEFAAAACTGRVERPAVALVGWSRGPGRDAPAPALAESEPSIDVDLERAHEGPRGAVVAPQLGRGVRRFAWKFAAWTVTIAMLGLAGNAGASLYQRRQFEKRQLAREALETAAMSGLRADVEDIAVGPGKTFELSLYLWNVTGGEELYVMAPEVRAYVQVGSSWQEVPLRAVDGASQQVMKIAGRQTFRYVFEPELERFEELIPGYMHVRFANAMLVSQRAEPKDDLIDRSDNYYVYLKPHGADEERILKASRFPGKPPVWIPMPPH